LVKVAELGRHFAEIATIVMDRRSNIPLLRRVVAVVRTMASGRAANRQPLDKMRIFLAGNGQKGRTP
jgi:hypothetical protein